MRNWIVAMVALAAAGPAVALDFVVASPEQGAAVLTADDDYLAALSPADLSIRLHADAGAVGELKALYAASVEPWSEAETARLSAMIERRRAQLAPLAPWLPDTVLIAKTSARVDGGLPHTRGNAIFIGPGLGSALPATDAELDELFLHELFHVLSRHNAAIHDAFYALVGFQRCSAVDLPPELRAMMLTNPDAPVVNYVAPAAEGAPFAWLTPILVADPPRYSPASPGFTDYFGLRFYAFERDAAGACAVARGADGAPVRIGQAEAMPMLYAVAGRNTDYVLHPEELMADNFAQLMTGRPDAPDPQVQQNLAALLGIAAPPAR